MRQHARRSAIVGTAVFLFFPAAAGSQVAGGVQEHVEIRQLRDRVPPKPLTGTGSVKGRVVDGVTGEPVPRARVRLLMGGAMRPFVLSGSDGTFSFTELPTGGFSIAAEKSGYLQGRLPEAGRTIRGSSPIFLREGQTLDRVVVRMYRGSAISGRVLDAHGDPVEYASVSALRLIPGGKPQQRAGQQTNDLGEFRLPRLEAGNYVVVVSPARHSHEEMPAGSEQQPQPVPTYYPSTVSIDQAQPLALERGQSVSGVDIVLAEGTLVTVTGVVVRRDGQPITGHGFVNARSVGRMGMMDGGGTSVRPDGTFRLLLPPGEYAIQAHVRPQTINGPPPRGSDDTGFARVSLGGSPVETVTIAVGAPATASGRVLFEGTTPPPAAPPGPLRLPLYSEVGDCQTGEAQVSADWTFKVDGLMGTCTAPARLTFGRWTLKAATRGDLDLLDKPVTFEPGQHLDAIQLIFTDRRSEMQFQVSDDKGQATTDYVAIVFSTDRTRWESGAGSVQPFHIPSPMTMQMLAQSMSSAPREAQLGFESLKRRAMPVTPGEYFVIAIDDIAYEEMRAPGVLERLAAHAARVTVAEGAKLEVALRRFALADLLR